MKNVNEGRSQIKRQYGQYSKIRVNEKAPIRNKVLNFVGKRFVTEDEMKNHLTELTEDLGKEFDQRKWFKNNQKYFEFFENRGQKVLTLSKYGKRVHEFINKPKENNLNESTEPIRIGLFKNSLFESFINEAKIANPSDIKDGATSLTDRINMVKSDSEEAGEDVCDMKLLSKWYSTLSKTLKTPENKLMIIDSESNAYDFVYACCIGLQKRREAGDENIKLITELSFNSAWHSTGQRRPAFHWHIVDANIDIVTFEDGDDYSDFSMVVYSKAQEKSLIDWANKNLTEADMEY